MTKVVGKPGSVGDIGIESSSFGSFFALFGQKFLSDWACKLPYFDRVCGIEDAITIDLGRGTPVAAILGSEPLLTRVLWNARFRR